MVGQAGKRGLVAGKRGVPVVDKRELGAGMQEVPMVGKQGVPAVDMQGVPKEAGLLGVLEADMQERDPGSCSPVSERMNQALFECRSELISL